MKLRAALLSVIIFSSLLFAQKQAPAPPQTARQALIEIITGGQKAFGKHLTVEVQQLLAKAGPRGTAAFGMLDIPHQLGGEIQTFETGPVLLTVNQPAEHEKLEVRIENDDLSGDEDTMELSLHVTRENSDKEPEDWENFLSHFNVNLKMQAGIWRLNKVGVGLEFPLGDPEFLQKTFLKGMDHASSTGLTASAGGAEASTNSEKPETNFSPEQLITMMTMAEYFFARQHPDSGFTCSIADLAESGKSLGLDQQLSSGIYHGYRFSLSGCQGRPVGSFQLVAEPVDGSASKAFCTDATRNVRFSDDGRGATCLSAGKVNRPVEAVDDGMVGGRIAINPGSSKQ